MSVNSWNDSTPGTASRMNKTGVISGTGSYLAGLDKSQHKLLHCTSTGSGFTLDHIYLCSTDGTSALDLTGISDHLHNNVSGQGGSIVEMVARSPEQYDSGMLYMNGMMFLNWISSVTSTGAVTDYTSDSTYTWHILKVDSGATSGATANLTLSGDLINWDRENVWAARLKLNETTSNASHWGFGVEKLGDADDNVRKQGIVHCTTTNNNWFARTANGTSRSDSDTGIAISTNYIPVVSRVYPDTPLQETFIDENTIFDKTSDIPIDGASPDYTKLFRYGIKNSTGSSRVAYLIQLRYAYWGGSNFYG